jgi:hypothetical protein
MNQDHGGYNQDSNGCIIALEALNILDEFCYPSANGIQDIDCQDVHAKDILI